MCVLFVANSFHKLFPRIMCCTPYACVAVAWKIIINRMLMMMNEV